MRLERHPANPIIPVVPGTWHNFVTANADVIRVGDEWRLYFRGNSKQTDGTVNAAIGLLTCPVDGFDGVTWQAHAGNPVTRPGPAGSFDDLGALDPAIVEADGRFLLYYTAVPQERPESVGRGWGHSVKSIGLAVSDDGLRFERWGNEPLIPAFAAAPEVVRHAGEYWMFYSALDPRGGTDICLVRSPDPYRFDHTRRRIVLTVGEPGSWEGLTVTTHRIFRDNGLWYMVYAGSDRHEDTPWHFGVAASHDLVTWTRYPGNPIFERGPEGTWDDCGIWYGTTEKIDGVYYMWYEGRSSGEPRHIADTRPGGRGRGGISQIGLATMRSDTFFFTL